MKSARRPLVFIPPQLWRASAWIKGLESLNLLHMPDMRFSHSYGISFLTTVCGG